MKFDTVNFFPTTAYIGKIENHNTYKKEFYKVYPKFDWEEDEYDVTVSENIGNPLIHLENSLNSLFEDIVSHIKNYSHNILLLKDIFDFTITKTWLSRSRRSKDEIPWHIHSTSHISFVYYINIPNNSHSLKFLNQNQPNSLFLGMSSDNRNHSRRLIRNYNNVNCETFFITPMEGNVIIFPSKTTHSTSSMISNFEGERLAVVGDVTLVLKEEHLSHSMGYIHQKYWKTYK
jgi:hypothetical protein